MIFVSSSCVKNKKIAESVEQLAQAGYLNIELSGGTEAYSEMENDLQQLKMKYQINYLCHNYFPPPANHFVINLASLDEETYFLTKSHIENSLELSKKLGASRFGFHAGFLINIPVHEIGQPVQRQELFDRQNSLERFVSAFIALKEKYPDLQLYLENNVLSEKNLQNFLNVNPLFLCDLEGYKEIRERMNFNLLLDVAHLKVSSNSLNLNFEEQLRNLLGFSDYIHISDNDGKVDSNDVFRQDSELFRLLKKSDFKNKICTVEVYGSMDKIAESYESVKQLYV